MPGKYSMCDTIPKQVIHSTGTYDSLPVLYHTSSPTRGPTNSARIMAFTSFIKNITLIPTGAKITYPPPTNGSATTEELALQWLIVNDTLNLSPAINPRRLRQRYALLTFFLSAFTVSNAWLQSEDECGWRGISCDKENSVTTIDLYDKSLRGHIPADIGLLSNMIYFSVSMNAMSGTLPNSIWALDQLGNFFDLG